MEKQDIRTATTLDLEEALCTMNGEITKAVYVVQELVDEFFRPLAKEDYKPSPIMTRAEAIVYDFDRAAAFAEVLSDIIYRMRDTLAKLNTEQIIEQIRADK